MPGTDYAGAEFWRGTRAPLREATGLDPALFRPKVDSTYALDCGQTTGSRATLFGGRVGPPIWRLMRI